MSWYLEALKNYSVFSGRSRRKEYWYFVLCNVIVSLVLSGLDALLGTFSFSANLGLLSGIYALAIIIPSLSVSVRRLHDIDRTGWWIMLAFVPVAGLIVAMGSSVMMMFGGGEIDG